MVVTCSEDKADDAARKAKSGLNDADKEGKNAADKAGDKADQAGKEGKGLLKDAEGKAKKVAN